MKSSESLSTIRQYIHQYPETAGKEKNTASIIHSHLEQYQPTTIVTNLGGYGLAAIYTSQKPGPIIIFRAELDALPIPEINIHKYRSQNRGRSHACGHDGHMTILLGIASYLYHHPEEIKGKIVLLFQPSEEIAAGAHKICSTSFYRELNPDYVYALHNLPGFTKGAIVLKKGIFAIASQGIIIKLTGATAHAGHPKQGNNPVFGMTEIIQKITSISEEYNKKNTQAMITIIHLELGEIAFGTTPGTGTIMATLRAPTNTLIAQMSTQVTNAISTTAQKYHLEQSIKWVEKFPATKNHTSAITHLENAASHHNMEIINLRTPFSWTEDFSYYLENTPGALFGLGSGKNHAPLHSQTYDFPDSILNNGIRICLQLIREINQP
jgi:amidohydrolase